MALDPDALRFMLSTSITDTVCGSLADAITGDERLGPAARRARAGERLHHATRRPARVVPLSPPAGRAPPVRAGAASPRRGPAAPPARGDLVRGACAAGARGAACDRGRRPRSRGTGDQRELPPLHRVGPDGDGRRLARLDAGRCDRGGPPARRRAGLDDALPRTARGGPGGARIRHPGAGQPWPDAGRGELDRRDGRAAWGGVPGRRRRGHARVGLAGVRLRGQPRVAVAGDRPCAARLRARPMRSLQRGAGAAADGRRPGPGAARCGWTPSAPGRCWPGSRSRPAIRPLAESHAREALALGDERGIAGTPTVCLRAARPRVRPRPPG